MSGPRIGSLCSGYGGLDRGVQAVLGGTTAWVSDIDKGANKILAHRYPDVPNLGDFTGTDWAAVEPVDVLTAGFPCQPVSHAGHRLGDADERWLWDDVARAVSELRPRHVVLENVRGLLTTGSGRLFGRVLGTLADHGYDAQWHGLRAADIGAAHGRWRVFILATDPTQPGRQAFSGGGLAPAPAQLRAGLDHQPATDDTGLLPTPLSRDWKNAGHPGRTAGRMAARGQPLTEIACNATWGNYAAAVARWEHIMGRPAPEPTLLSARGNPQLSARFVEWLMGLPAGWVTDVPGITRTEALKALGNGVVWQQCAAALQVMLTRNGQELAA